MTSRIPPSTRRFDSLSEVKKHLDADLVFFKSKDIEEPYEGIIITAYVEVATALGEQGFGPGDYLLEGKRGLFKATPSAGKWKPISPGDAEYDGDDEAEAEPEAEGTQTTVDSDIAFPGDEDLPDVPDDSEFAEWEYADVRRALAEEGWPATGPHDVLLKRLHWYTHGAPGTTPEEVAAAAGFDD